MPTMRSILARAFAPLRRAAEGAPRSGPHYLPISGGWLPAGADWGWWQQGHSLLASDRSAVVERCISLYAQTIASLPGSHWRANNRGGRTRVTNSALARILKRPNDYQSNSDFMLNAVRVSREFERASYKSAASSIVIKVPENPILKIAPEKRCWGEAPLLSGQLLPPCRLI